MCGAAPTLSTTTITHARDEGDVWNSKGKYGGKISEWSSHVERPFRAGVQTPKDTRGEDPNEWVRVHLRVGLDKILAACQLVSLVAGSARLDSAHFSFFMSCSGSLAHYFNEPSRASSRAETS